MASAAARREQSSSVSRARLLATSRETDDALREERRRSSRRAGWIAWGGRLMSKVEVQRMSRDEQTTPRAVADFAANVRADIRKRGQGEKGRGSGLGLSVPRPVTAPGRITRQLGPDTTETFKRREGDLYAKLGTQLRAQVAASESMQRSAARLHLLSSPMAATARAFLPIQLSPSPPCSPRSSARSQGSGRLARVDPAIDESNGTQACKHTTLSTRVATQADVVLCASSPRLSVALTISRCCSFGPQSPARDLLPHWTLALWLLTRHGRRQRRWQKATLCVCV